MPLFEYVLVALMGAAGHSSPMTSLGPEAIAQPNGGALFVAPQETPKKEDSRRNMMLKHRYNKVRHHKHRHRRPGVYTKKDTK